MHGSPISKWDNRKLWERYNYRDYGVNVEPYFDINYGRVFYITDTGRAWNNKNTNFRDTVDSIVQYVNASPLVSADKFIGQQKRNKGKKIEKGMTQKEQLAMLDRFRNGEINTLVATSVAEEGLDIPQCDLVISYDVLPSEIRTIQRRGRTGRQSKGALVFLIAKGTREEGYYYAEKRREKQMKRILSNFNNRDFMIFNYPIIGFSSYTIYIKSYIFFYIIGYCLFYFSS